MWERTNKIGGGEVLKCAKACILNHGGATRGEASCLALARRPHSSVIGRRHNAEMRAGWHSGSAEHARLGRSSSHASLCCCAKRQQTKERELRRRVGRAGRQADKRWQVQAEKVKPKVAMLAAAVTRCCCAIRAPARARHATLRRTCCRARHVTQSRSNHACRRRRRAENACSCHSARHAVKTV